MAKTIRNVLKAITWWCDDCCYSTNADKFLRTSSEGQKKVCTEGPIKGLCKKVMKQNYWNRSMG